MSGCGLVAATRLAVAFQPRLTLHLTFRTGRCFQTVRSDRIIDLKLLI